MHESPSNLQLSLREVDDDEYREYVTMRLRAFNDSRSPWFMRKRMPGNGPKSLDVYLIDGNDDTMGGALGNTLWGWLEIENLWVDERLRGQG